ncbi:VIT1/CCC1 transporter family protein [Clostridium sp. C105KSO13]|uniref:VIT1/CCC1 transporter family protein n=1 Tax=Clostridium sp. C105KSO13 TaxID=1776045 RepID=UPI00074064E2|nr:VIT1/CCC1 family protein [Clostridium sp. C105KSO13]CUX37954.1 VIT family protein [Clostridium sp. C105KSO13]
MTKDDFKKLQKNEVQGAALYQKIAEMTKDKKEKEILMAISKDEWKHAKTFGKYSTMSMKPNSFYVFFFALLARILGYTFIIKFLERNEDKGIAVYEKEISEIPELPRILEDEERHEKELLDMLDEERLQYIGDIVLGMNDALVELTGALAGYTLAMQNTHVIAMAGMITGVSATLSMAASGYLSSREQSQKNAAKSSVYTGLAYLITVALLIIPYLVMPQESYIAALIITLIIAIAIIAAFNFYISIAKGRAFKKNFLLMSAISLGVSVITFGIGLVVKNVLGIDL